ncbi:MAG: TonB-dependent receptor [Gammaproteobacteria bacterium]|nr:TonB-dependent receptor [Gammaproteobacteria bacterium]
MKNDKSLLRQAVTLALLTSAAAVWAQDEPEAQQVDPNQPIEEVVVVGRFLSAAESLVNERITVPFSADFLGADVIARAADPDIASALRRVPGLTVVDGKFVYVRGLGERYSNVMVNGAAVPSPELTRSVIPLDLFPTSIVESIKIQKSPSPNVPANFGGGAIDIRTTGIPNDVVAEVRLGMGYNEISDSNGRLFPTTGSPLPPQVFDAINTYRGNVSVTRILSTLRQTDPLAPFSQAESIHQGLIDSMDLNIGGRTESLDPDTRFRGALGNSWDLNQDWRIGALFNVSYRDSFRNEDQARRNVGSPDTRFFDVERTVQEERTVGAINVGLEYLADHSLNFASYVIQNDEAQANASRGYDTNNELIDGDQRIIWETRLEQRELKLNQLSGSHVFADTGGIIGQFLDTFGLTNLEFDWFLSDAVATTDIPNQGRFNGGATVDPNTQEVLSERLQGGSTQGRFSWLNLEDNQLSWGGNLVLPIEFENTYVTVSGGWWGTQKDRDYRGYTLSLNAIQSLPGDPATALTPANVTVDNGYELSLVNNLGTESYLATQNIDAYYGMVDVDLSASWRFTAGWRYEDFRQTVLPVDLLDFSGQSIVALQEALAQPDQRLAIQEDDNFGSMALTFNSDGLFGSEQYQIRASYGETVVRPDLREVAPVTYIDPDLFTRVSGFDGLQSSPIDNFEIRGEFFYGNGDNFTVSLFAKDILAPIERVRRPGTDDDFLLTFENGLSGEISGIEFEGLKSLPAGFFLSGNVTLSDSEVVLDPNSPNDITNFTRRMTGHSEWVANATLGFDSDNGMHSAYLNYNAFGERIFAAGANNNGDVFEQPFDSLGLVYKWFPTDQIEVQVRLDNILDETRRFEQISGSSGNQGETVTVLEQEVGATLGVSARFFF